jgi:hypothetical protein
MRRKYSCPLFFAALLVSVLSCTQPEGADVKPAAYNPDLFGWRTASWSPFTVTDSIKAFAYGNGVYVAVASNGVIAYSYNGDIWEWARKAEPAVLEPAVLEPLVPEPFKLESGADANFNAAAFGGGVFIAAADGGHIAYSYDGVYWTGVTGATGFGNENINGVAYGVTSGVGCFVAVGNNGNISAALSSAPESWKGGGVSGFSAIKDVAFGNGKFYVAGDDGRMGWASVPSPNFTPANTWNWHPFGWTFRAQAGTFTPYVRKIAFGEYGHGTPGLGITFNEWGGKRIAVCAVSGFEAGNPNAWDSDIDAGFFGSNVTGIVWSSWDGGIWLAAGTSAMIGYWPSPDPSDTAERYWRALSFYEFRWWEITALAVLNGRYFAGNAGGKIGYSK